MSTDHSRNILLCLILASFAAFAINTGNDLERIATALEVIVHGPGPVAP